LLRPLNAALLISSHASGDSQAKRPAAEDTLRPRPLLRVVIPFPVGSISRCVEVGFEGNATQTACGPSSYWWMRFEKVWIECTVPRGSAQVRESEWLIPGGKQRLFRLTTDRTFARYPESIAQKVLLIGIERIERRISDQLPRI
jgi:hypothetical protein